MDISYLKSGLPPPWPHDLTKRLRELNRTLDRSIIVIDDDPTGCQTLSDIPLLLQWERKDIIHEFKKRTPLFFILSNSRSHSEKDAMRLMEEIACNCLQAAKKTGRKFTVISRSDSTLRGHYPAEVNQLQQTLGLHGALHCVVPAFFQGGRYTVNDIHYVQENDQLIPAAETPFAKDSSFGYNNSDLNKWVGEKTEGAVTPEEILSFGLEDLRTGGPEYVTHTLTHAGDKKVIIVNAAEQSDMDVFSLGALDAELKGVELIYRTGASFLNSFGGLPAKPPIGRALSEDRRAGGLIIVGSYVPKSSAQLHRLLEDTDIHSYELDIEALLAGKVREEVNRATRFLNRHIGSQKDVVMFTPREYISLDDPEEELKFGSLIMRSINTVVNNLATAPGHIISKGGITSYEVARSGLKVKKARVIGQALPGIPVWELDDQSRFPGILYVVFPGNVGDENTLVDLYKLMHIT